VVLRVEDGDLVQQGQRLLQGRGELGVERHGTRRGCFYRGLLNDMIKHSRSIYNPAARHA
jgi:hypothetical protein